MSYDVIIPDYKEDFLASNTGWSNATREIEKLSSEDYPKTISLVIEGYSDDLEDLSKELDKILSSTSISEDTIDILSDLRELVSGAPKDSLAFVTNGGGSAADEPDKDTGIDPKSVELNKKAEALLKERGLLRPSPVTDNVYCPTGKGGGVDPTCSPKGLRTSAGKSLLGKIEGSSVNIDDFKEALDTFPEEALDRIDFNTKRVVVTEDLEELSDSVESDFEGFDAAGGLGFWGVQDGEDKGTIYLNGAGVGVAAHELSHALDGVDTTAQLSNSEDWEAAWELEISVNVPKDIPRGRPFAARTARLSQYAATDAVEGFAEFGRLVSTNPKRAQSDFPKCWAFWKEQGIL